MTISASLQAYTITYNNLSDAKHSNPEVYTASDLPITLSAPETRAGYAFTGWFNESGESAAEIPAGTTGDITLTAVWDRLTLSFDANAPCVCRLPQAIPAEQGRVVIPAVVPCRPGHLFVCWNMPESGTGKIYFPGDTILVSADHVTLYAQWQSLGCSCIKTALPNLD